MIKEISIKTFVPLINQFYLSPVSPITVSENGEWNSPRTIYRCLTVEGQFTASRLKTMQQDPESFNFNYCYSRIWFPVVDFMFTCWRQHPSLIIIKVVSNWAFSPKASAIVISNRFNPKLEFVLQFSRCFTKGLEECHMHQRSVFKDCFYLPSGLAVVREIFSSLVAWITNAIDLMQTN